MLCVISTKMIAISVGHQKPENVKPLNAWQLSFSITSSAKAAFLAELCQGLNRFNSCKVRTNARELPFVCKARETYYSLSIAPVISKAQYYQNAQFFLYDCAKGCFRVAILSHDIYYIEQKERVVRRAEHDTVSICNIHLR